MDIAGAALSCPKGSYTATLVETAVTQGKCQEEDKSWWSQKICERELRWGLECMKAANREHIFKSMVKSLAARLAAKDSEMAFVDNCWRVQHDMTNVDGKKQFDEQNAIIKQRDAIIVNQAATIADRDALLADKDEKIAYQASALRSPEAHVMEACGSMIWTGPIAEEQIAQMYYLIDMFKRLTSKQQPSSSGNESLFAEHID